MANFGLPTEKENVWKEVGFGLGRISTNWYKFFHDVRNWIIGNSQSGSTAQRPTTDLYNGKRYIDETLNMEITYINGAWRDGQGNSV